MSTQSELAASFQALHVKGDPVILYNIWDAGSAKAVVDAGAKAIATGSAPVAMANGFSDGQALSMEFALANAERIVGAVDLPVTLDFEGGYSEDPKTCGANFAKALTIGVVGFNFEDQVVGGSGLHPVEDQVTRLRAARDACDASGVAAFINARTDVFLKAYAAKADVTPEMLDEALARADAYTGAGASGFFAPGLMDLGMIEALCAKCTLPVNIIALPGAPSNQELAKVGVARISYGPVPYRKLFGQLTEHAKAVFDGS